MITLQNLCKTFVLDGHRRVVADDISISFPAKSSVALLGRNGTGKSTLLSMIAGITDYDSGSIICDGSVSWPVGFRGSFHPDLTGEQNTKFVARVYGVDTEELIDFARSFADLGGHFYQPVRSYSAGMRSRLSFGISMGIQFDTYLVDEVTSVGDAVFKRKSRNVLLQRLETSGAIVVSHAMRTIRRICTSAAVLEEGKLIYYPDVEEGIAAHLEMLGVSQLGEDGIDDEDT